MTLEPIDFQAPDAAQRFVESLRTIGFGVLTNHPIAQPLVEKIYADWQGFFHSNEKKQFIFNSKTQDDFFPASISETVKGHSVKDIKEYFHVYPWGQIPPTAR